VLTPSSSVINSAPSGSSNQAFVVGMPVAHQSPTASISGPDTTLPSIEMSPEVASSSVSSRSHLRTPSVSVSPPPRPLTGPASDVAHFHRSVSESSINLADIAAALPQDPIRSARQQSEPLLPSGRTRTPRVSRARRSLSPDDRKYDPAEERPPNDRFNQEEFQLALRQARSLPTELARVLGSITVQPDSILERLRQQAVRLSSFEAPPTRTVGFVGDTGVGEFEPEASSRRTIHFTDHGDSIFQGRVVSLTHC
jgi:hypothetical protein